VNELKAANYFSVDSFFTPEEWGRVTQAFASRWDNGKFREAGVGPGEGTRELDVRGDSVFWLQGNEPELAWWFDKLKSIREQVNQELFLGLVDEETHFASYPAGSFYKRHLDQFRGDDRRVLSFIVYLHEEWREEWGGQLRLYPGSGTVDLFPVPNRAVFFLSGELEHEVLPMLHSRRSLTGWFRRRS